MIRKKVTTFDSDLTSDCGFFIKISESKVSINEPQFVVISLSSKLCYSAEWSSRTHCTGRNWTVWNASIRKFANTTLRELQKQVMVKPITDSIILKLRNPWLSLLADWTQ